MAGEQPLVNYQLENRVATITISREQSLNALNVEVLEALGQQVQKLREICSGKDAYQTCRCVVLRGKGEKAFVAGADIKVMHGAARSELERFIGLGQRVMREIETLPLPVLAVVHGFAIGGGLELALASDLIIASDRARLGQAEVNLGLIPGFGGTQRLAARLGPGRTKRLVYTGDTIGAEEAFRLGVVDYLFPHDQLEQKVAEIALAVASKSPQAIAAAKRVIQTYFEQQLLHGLSREVEEFLLLSQTEDAKEGLSAFVEKRPPTFPGN